MQVIRRAKGKGGVLEFGTTVLSAADGSIAGLLGASPGASTAVPAMLDVMERCFGDRYQSWLPKLKEMVPSLGTELSKRAGAVRGGVVVGHQGAQAGPTREWPARHIRARRVRRRHGPLRPPRRPPEAWLTV